MVGIIWIAIFGIVICACPPKQPWGFDLDWSRVTLEDVKKRIDDVACRMVRNEVRRHTSLDVVSNFQKRSGFGLCLWRIQNGIVIPLNTTGYGGCQKPIYLQKGLEQVPSSLRNDGYFILHHFDMCSAINFEGIASFGQSRNWNSDSELCRLIPHYRWLQENYTNTFDAGSKISWEDRIPELFWRGGYSSATRLEIVKQSLNTSGLNAKMTYWYPPSTPKELTDKPGGRSQQIKYRYLMAIDGHGWSGSFQWMLGSGSTVIRIGHVKSWDELLYKPWVHYLPVRAIVSKDRLNKDVVHFRPTLDWVVDWLKRNPVKAKNMALRSKALAPLVASLGPYTYAQMVGRTLQYQKQI